ncbi:MAG: CPBP family intramembrane glutamic endopeptidase [Elusimicrobiales bacterium]|nr:CPBP family intramembrane glutamic endopeptidase [Elusimicrobiales bacterium]
MNGAEAIAAAPPAPKPGPWLLRSTTLAGLTLAVPSLTYFGLNKILSEGYPSLPAHMAEFLAASAALFLTILTFKVYNDKEKVGLDIRSVFSLRPFGRSAGFLALFLSADLALTWTGLRLIAAYYPETEGPAALARMWASRDGWFFMALSTMFMACCEELMLRGLALNYIMKRAGFAKALLWTSLLFMIFHGDRNWIGMLIIFSSGALYALAYRRTGSLAVPCLLHGLHNLILRAAVVLDLHLWLY